MGAPSNRTATLESQMIPMIQDVPGQTLRALRRIADDLANRYVVLGDIWDIDAKRAYLDRLEGEGILPTAANSLASKVNSSENKPAVVRPSPIRVARPQTRTTLIPNAIYAVAWAGRIQRHRQIWESNANCR
jgi:hypothetical protein